MYRKPYRGYKSDRFRFSKPHNIRFFSFDKFDLFKLKNIRFILIFLIILIVSGTIIAVVVINSNKPEKESDSVMTTVETVDDSLLLRVVNKNNPLGKSYVPSLEKYNGFLVNSLAVKPLEQLIVAAEKDEVDLRVEVAYVSYEQQQISYENAYNKLLDSGNYTRVTAEAKAQHTTPKGGNSEYQTGLLFRFTTDDRGNSFRNTNAFRWLEKNAVDYGFIVRYTEDKEGITMVNGDSAIYRYVGKENAEFMRTLNMCLDEYISYISSRE